MRHTGRTATPGRCESDRLVEHEHLEAASSVLDGSLPVSGGRSAAGVLELVRGDVGALEPDAGDLRTLGQSVEVQLGSVVAADHLDERVVGFNEAVRRDDAGNRTR